MSFSEILCIIFSNFITLVFGEARSKRRYDLLHGCFTNRKHKPHASLTVLKSPFWNKHPRKIHDSLYHRLKKDLFVLDLYSRHEQHFYYVSELIFWLKRISASCWGCICSEIFISLCFHDMINGFRLYRFFWFSNSVTWYLRTSSCVV